MVKRPRLALVIGSGGLKCAAAVGVMQVLEEENIDVDMVVGCSGGAVFGACIAMGWSSERIVEAHSRTWTEEVTKKLDYLSLLKIGFPSLMGFDDHIGIFDDRVMVENIERGYGPESTFANTKIPFHCVATDFHTGEQVVISEGSLAEAARISSGIPIVFKPVEWKGKLLIDGGFSNPLPVDVAIQEGADVIIAIGFEMPLQPSVTSPGNFANQMFNILVNQLLAKKFAFYNLAHHSEIIAIIPEFKEDIKISDVSKMPTIIEQGRKEMLKHVTYLKKMLASPTANINYRSHDESLY
jgi:NTE family protein